MRVTIRRSGKKNGRFDPWGKAGVMSAFPDVSISNAITAWNKTTVRNSTTSILGSRIADPELNFISCPKRWVSKWSKVAKKDKDVPVLAVSPNPNFIEPAALVGVGTNMECTLYVIIYTGQLSTVFPPLVNESHQALRNLNGQSILP